MKKQAKTQTCGTSQAAACKSKGKNSMKQQTPGAKRKPRRHIHIPSQEQAVRRLIEVSKNSWLGTDCKTRETQQQPRNPHGFTDYFGMD